MAFNSITEKWGVGSGQTLSDEGKTSGVASRILEGFSNDPVNDSEATFKLYLPAVGSIHPRLGVAYRLNQVSISQKSPVHYEASLSYQAPESDDPDNQTYPWNEPAQIEYSTLSESGETEFDADDDEIATVNGEPFAVSVDYADQGITIKKAFLGYEPSSFYEFIRTVNEDEFLTFPAGVLRVTGISASPDKHEEIAFYNVTVNIAARKPINTTNEKAWYWRGPQKGTMVLPEATSTKSVHAMDGGKKVTSPVFINADGTRKGSADPIHFIEKKLYETVKFSDMNLLP